jgi:hypothetical protein
MLDLELPQSLGPGQGRLETVDTAIEIVLRLIEDFLGLQNLQDTILTLEDLFCEQEGGQFLYRDLGLLALCDKEVGSLRR